ncbi:MAG: hypothetical protein HKM93_00420 [Desulfobacteraceae bacterium]|nr:hypothetical protein [Desulfobacteraceae bacterium]
MKEHQERREDRERRSGIDRRKVNPSHYTGIEKRSDTECRSGRDRREDAGTWSEMQTYQSK